MKPGLPFTGLSFASEHAEAWSLYPHESDGLWCWQCTLSSSMWPSEELWEGTVADWKVVLGTKQHHASQHHWKNYVQLLCTKSLLEIRNRSGKCLHTLLQHEVVWSTAHQHCPCSLGQFSTPEPHSSSVCESCLQQLPRWPGQHYITATLGAAASLSGNQTQVRQISIQIQAASLYWFWLG